MVRTGASIIAGVTGIAGRNLAEHLLASAGWEVRRDSRAVIRSRPCPACADRRRLARRRRGARRARRGQADHLFPTTWLRQATEAENQQPLTGRWSATCLRPWRTPSIRRMSP